MIIKLREAYNNEWPSWLKKSINTSTKDYGYSIGDLLARENVDVANVTVHTDFRKEYLKDGSKICFILFPHGYGQDILVIRGSNVIKEVQTYVNDRYTKLSTKSAKWISENMGAFCWIDALETDRSSIHRDSRIAADKDPRKTRGQYIQKKKRKNDDGTYAKDEFDNYIEDDVWTSYGKSYNASYDPRTGRTSTRYPSWKDTDKSGYLTDPDKYSRMLNHVGKENYAEQLERFYKQAREALNYCRTLEDEMFAPADFSNNSKSLDSYSVREVFSSKDELIKYYNGMISEIKSALSSEKKYGPDRFIDTLWERIDQSAQIFKRCYKEFKKNRERVNNLKDELKNQVEEEDDD